MNLPEKIKIGGINYDVVLVSSKSEELNFGEAIGYITEVGCKIYISEDLPLQKQQETLIHEIIHAIFNFIGFNNSIHKEESVKKIGRVLYQVLMDNKIIL